MAWSDTSSSIVPASVASAPAVKSRVQPSLSARLWDRYRGWQAQRRTLRLLYSLDDATLRDIGVSPRQIDGLVYGDGSDTIRRYDRNWWRF